jgi:translation elongation factor P/translation initiation factor 5A
METTIRLQGIGLVKGIKASELQVGMRLVWNYGSAYDVVSIAPKGQQSLTVVERSIETGKEYTRTMRQNRTVAAYWPK